MIKANYNDKPQVINILSTSFDSNKSVNFVAKQDEKRKQRIRTLIEYSFEICHMFGEVYLSEDRNACALLLFPERKRTTPQSIFWDLKLALDCIGITRIGKVLSRESKIKSNHPKEPIFYLWFLGVDPAHHKKGIGSKLLGEIIDLSTKAKKSIYLETSTLPNIPWYKKFGFQTVKELDLGYKLFVMKREYA